MLDKYIPEETRHKGAWSLFRFIIHMEVFLKLWYSLRHKTHRGEMMNSNCESCMNYEYDDEYECYVCIQNLDEDEMYRFVKGEFKECPYYRFGDEYQIVRKQI